MSRTQPAIQVPSSTATVQFNESVAPILWDTVPELAGAVYVEGYAVIERASGRGLVIEHGWIEHDGRIVDPTLHGERETAYFAGLRFTLPERLAVSSEVWSVAGARIRVLTRDRYYEAGENDVEWDGKNDRGEAVASGVYFIRLKTRVGEQVTRAVLLK